MAAFFPLIQPSPTVASMLGLGLRHERAGRRSRKAPGIAGAGAAFAFHSPTLDWIGTASTGLDTSANSVFATVPQSAGKTAGIDQTLLVAASG